MWMKLSNALFCLLVIPCVASTPIIFTENAIDEVGQRAFEDQNFQSLHLDTDAKSPGHSVYRSDEFVPFPHHLPPNKRYADAIATSYASYIRRIRLQNARHNFFRKIMGKRTRQNPSQSYSYPKTALQEYPRTHGTTEVVYYDELPGMR